MSALPEFTMRELLEAGVHFGHKTQRWNPKMSEYIYGDKNGVHIMDLRKTVPMLHQALVQIKSTIARNGRVVFVGTKPQAQDIIKEEAQRCGQHYINKRWLGGTLTNWKTISDSIRRLRKYQDLLDNEGTGLKKKEKLELSRKVDKLEASIGGIKEIGGVPDLLIIIDTRKESLAILEAKKLGIPIIAVVDSNCNPTEIDFPIPGNDDSIRSIKLYCKLFSDAVLSGIEESLVSTPKELVDIANKGGNKKAENKNDNAPKAANDENVDAKKAEEPKPAEKGKVETVVKKSRSVKKDEPKKEEDVEKKAEEPKAVEKKEAEEVAAPKAKPAAKKAEKKPAAKKDEKKPAAKKTAAKKTTKKEEK
ncbi:MAG: 30S ribosomal protein S2 [Alphaproteobacteria bacterium CG11_big_fil_rev_8_21_14_0_20_44_7]|nr:MAG: 30S ribosomal protein S2 [Alphaproteobacteria bacterium CG11_big_fil_rev_8_21_14_0_20_44_7]